MRLQELLDNACVQVNRVDAFCLIEHILQFSKAQVLAHPERVISTVEQAAFDALIQRRIQGEPIAYLTGVKEFWSLPLQINPSVLIPRPETEILVEIILSLYDNQSIRVVDLGTGSGAIALALAKERPLWQVTALDRSFDALEVARQNALNLGLPLHCIQSDWFSACEGLRFQVIASNPPYISSAEFAYCSRDLSFEPKEALVASLEGMSDLYYIIENAPNYLDFHGLLIMEHAPQQAEVVREAMLSRGFIAVCTVKDLAGLERITAGRTPLMSE